MAVATTFGLYGWDDPWDQPWYNGGAAPAPTLVPHAFPVAIAGHPYMVDFSKYRRTTMPIRRLPTDASVEPGENSLNSTGLWPRAQDNFFLGAGQLYLDNRFAFEAVYVHSGETPSVRTRYWRSKGLNPWSEGRLSMHNEYTLAGSTTNTNLKFAITPTRIYKTDGTQLYWSTNPSAGWTSAGMAAVLGATITGIATDGHQVWCCDGTNGVAYTTDGATTSTLGSGTYKATNLWYAKGFLLGTTGRDLVSIAADYTTTTIWTHPSLTFVWTCVTETPSCILVGGNTGYHAFIGALQADAATAGATLAVPVTATTLPEGEAINDMSYSAGFVILATSLGLRSGTRPDSSGFFDVNSVIEDPGNCLCVTPWHQYAYFGWTAYSTVDNEVYTTGVTSSGLGRADLSQYTSPGVPAYATDVMAPDGTSASVTDVAVLNGVPYFALSGVGVYAPSGNVVPSAFLLTGWVRYGTLENKILATSKPLHVPLLAGQQITMEVANEYTDIVTLGVSQTVGSTGPSQAFGGNLISGLKFMPIIVFTRGTDTTKGPILESWIDKSMVVPPRQDEIICPIILKTKVGGINNAQTPHTFNTLQEFLFLKSLESAGAPISFQEGSLTFEVYIDQIQMEPEQMNRMIDAEDYWFEGLLTVKLITFSTADG